MKRPDREPHTNHFPYLKELEAYADYLEGDLNAVLRSRKAFKKLARNQSVKLSKLRNTDWIEKGVQRYMEYYGKKRHEIDFNDGHTDLQIHHFAYHFIQEELKK